jgi:hypothetical protein
MRQRLSNKHTIILVILIALALNITSFCIAYPQISTPENVNYARDFSAYYTGEYRLFHNPTKIYFGGDQPGDYPIFPHSQTFKYAPSFLILLAPFLALNYQNALTVFDIIQLALIPVLAFFVYKLVKDKNIILGAAAAFIILIQPLPTPSINQPPLPLINLLIFSVNPQVFSPSYYCGYVYVNAHILQAVLLVGALYFGFVKKPWISALLFAFGLFDPRAAVITIPLLLWYNRQEIRQFLVAATAFILATNLPFFFYHDIGLTFLQTEMTGTVISQWYAYDWIPIYGVAALTILEILTVILKKHKTLSLFKNPKTNSSQVEVK